MYTKYISWCRGPVIPSHINLFLFYLIYMKCNIFFLKKSVFNNLVIVSKAVLKLFLKS